MTVVNFPARREHTRPLTKKQLAAELQRSPRWIENRMREGLPVLPRQSPHEHARFDLAAVRAWLADRAAVGSRSLEERVRVLEAVVADLQDRRTG